MASRDSQIDKPQHGHPKKAELLDVNINTGAQSINTERASIRPHSHYMHGNRVMENMSSCFIFINLSRDTYRSG